MPTSALDGGSVTWHLSKSSGYRRVNPGSSGYRRIGPGGSGYRRVNPGSSGYRISSQVLARSTVRAADDITTVNRRRNNPFRYEGGDKALEASPDKELLSSGGDITHCDVLPNC